MSVFKLNFMVLSRKKERKKPLMYDLTLVYEILIITFKIIYPNFKIRLIKKIFVSSS